jgi:hypothetical protein
MTHIVFRISTNTNSFGLYGFWVYDSASGEVHSAATSRRPTFGQVIKDLQHPGHYELLRHEFTIEPAKRVDFELLARKNIADQLSAEQKASLL